ncbi:MAG: hypothetical protein ACE5J3_04270 [Methanosarcinales archaeon]
MKGQSIILIPLLLAFFVLLFLLTGSFYFSQAENTIIIIAEFLIVGAFVLMLFKSF